jgi:hypothetical protein
VLLSFARHTEHLRFAELSAKDVETWIARPDLRPQSRVNMVNKLRPFVQWMVARDHLA